MWILAERLVEEANNSSEKKNKKYLEKKILKNFSNTILPSQLQYLLPNSENFQIQKSVQSLKSSEIPLYYSKKNTEIFTNFSKEVKYFNFFKKKFYVIP